MKTWKWPLWLIKIGNYEYWSWWAFYLPLIPYILYLAIRARSLTFFTAVDGCMPLGGLLGETKNDIFELIPTAYLPHTLFIPKEQPLEEVLKRIDQQAMHFPLIAKPNVGERGYQVKKIHTQTELQDYVNHFHEDYILQSFLDMPIELGVFFVRGTNGQPGYVTSVTAKEFLSVTGNGKDRVIDLLQSTTRGRFQVEAMKAKMGEAIYQIPENGKQLLLEPIGNHCRGTRFVNANYLINEQLHIVFRNISAQITGFDYGRYDLKVPSIADLYKGENIKIMEVNGVSSEPGHIYDQSVGLLKAYATLAWHWKQIFIIAQERKSAGYKPASLRTVYHGYTNHLK